MTAKEIKPWQTGAVELIAGAIEHLHRATDADNRMAFLLLDVGMETTLKNYLKLPDKVTHAKTSFSDRKKAAEGNFHEVLDGVEKAAIGKLQSIDLLEIQHYHGVRNKLYHDGSGITVSTKDVNAYARLAIALLKALLELDLSAEFDKPILDSQTKVAQKAEIEALKSAIQVELQAVEQLAKLGLEKIRPDLVLPSFEARFRKWVALKMPEFLQEEDAILKILFGEKSARARYELLIMPDEDQYTDLCLRVIEDASGAQLQLISPNHAHVTWGLLCSRANKYPSEWYPEVKKTEDLAKPEGYSFEVVMPPYQETVEIGKSYLADLKTIRAAIEQWLETAP